MRKQTASQTIGPFFHHVLTPHAHGKAGLADRVLVSDATLGERIRIEGSLRNAEGQPLRAGMVELWQANAHGRYRHPDDDRDDPPLDPAFAGFGRAEADPQGAFSFETIKPGPVPGPGNAPQSPHLNLVIFSSSLSSHLYTRLYFSDEEAANRVDPVLSSIEATRRETLIARRGAGEPGVFSLEVVVGGEHETVFFDL